MSVNFCARAVTERLEARLRAEPSLTTTLAAEHDAVDYPVARDLEKDLVPTLLELGIVELPYYALAAGFLSGKYRPGTKVESARAQGASKYLDDPRAVALLGVSTTSRRPAR